MSCSRRPGVVRPPSSLLVSGRLIRTAFSTSYSLYRRCARGLSQTVEEDVLMPAPFKAKLRASPFLGNRPPAAGLSRRRAASGNHSTMASAQVANVYLGSPALPLPQSGAGFTSQRNPLHHHQPQQPPAPPQRTLEAVYRLMYPRITVRPVEMICHVPEG